MSFKAEIDLCYKDFLTWIRVSAKTSHRVLSIVTIVFAVVATLLMATGIVLLIITDELGADMIFMICIFLISMMYLLFRGRINAKISQNRFTKGVGTIRLCVNDEGIYAETDKSEEKYFFSGVTAFYMTAEHFFILLDKNHALVIPKRSFTEGDPDSFGPYISEKTELELKMIKA